MMQRNKRKREISYPSQKKLKNESTHPSTMLYSLVQLQQIKKKLNAYLTIAIRYRDPETSVIQKKLVIVEDLIRLTARMGVLEKLSSPAAAERAETSALFYQISTLSANFIERCAPRNMQEMKQRPRSEDREELTQNGFFKVASIHPRSSQTNITESKTTIRLHKVGYVSLSQTDEKTMFMRILKEAMKEHEERLPCALEAQERGIISESDLSTYRSLAEKQLSLLKLNQELPENEYETLVAYEELIDNLNDFQKRCSQAQAAIKRGEFSQPQLMQYLNLVHKQVGVLKKHQKLTKEEDMSLANLEELIDSLPQNSHSPSM